MKISGVGPSRSSSTKKKDKATAADGEFAKHLRGSDEASGGRGGSESVSAVSGLDSLLAMQSVDPEAGRDEGRRRAVRRGEDLLSMLDEIRHGLLLGHIPKDRLTELARTVRSKREAGVDPEVGAILDEIELRAEVELAKLTRR